MNKFIFNFKRKYSVQKEIILQYVWNIIKYNSWLQWRLSQLVVDEQYSTKSGGGLRLFASLVFRTNSVASAEAVIISGPSVKLIPRRQFLVSFHNFQKFQRRWSTEINISVLSSDVGTSGSENYQKSMKKIWRCVSNITPAPASIKLDKLAIQEDNAR